MGSPRRFEAIAALPILWQHRRRAVGNNSIDDEWDNLLGDALPGVPTWGGADEKNRISIDPVTVPEPSDVIDVGDLGVRDLSANIRLDTLHPKLPAEGPQASFGDPRGIPEPVVESTEDPVVPPPFQSATDLGGVGPTPPPPLQVTEPAVPRPVDETTSAPGLEAPELHAADKEQRTSLRAWLMASGALIVVGAIAWTSMGSGEPRGALTVAAASPQAGVVAPRKADPPNKHPELPPPTPSEPAAVVLAATTGVTAAGAASEDSSLGGVGSDGGEAAERYDEGAARYERDRSQEALETMATAACALDDGVKARAAFRKLTGGDVRKRVMIACRSSAIDLNATTDQPTPAELLRAAERALDAGDHETAVTLARKSNRLERSQAAVYIIALAECAAGDKEKAASMRRHLNKARQTALAERCPDMPEPGS